MRTLFFTDSCEEDYQSVFMNGTRRRRKSKTPTTESSVVEDASAAETAKDPSTAV